MISIGAVAACGDNGKPIADLGTTTVDFGQVDCGTTAPDKAISIANIGAGALHYTATLGMGGMSPFSLSEPNGVVTVNNEIQLVVSARTVATDGGIAPLSDTLTIKTDAPFDTPHNIMVSLTPRGVVITASTTTVGFAGTPTVGAAGSPAAFTITNAGNLASTVSVATTDAAFSLDETPAMVAAGASIDRSVTYTPTTTTPSTSSLVISATGPLCAPIPTATASANGGTFAGTAKDLLVVGGPKWRARNNVETLCILLKTGQVACVGSNDLGARGAGQNVVANLTAPTLVRTDTGAILDKVTQLAGQRQQVCARRSDGSVWCWGNVGGVIRLNRSGTIINGGQPFASELISSNVVAISASYGMICAMLSGGGLTCNGTQAQSWNASNPGSWATAAGTTLSLNGCGGYSLQADGTVVGFGSTTNGIRPGTATNDAPPAAITGLANVTQVIAGAGRGNGGTNRCGGGCAVINDGTVQCWGPNRHGNVGNNTTVQQNAPVQVLTPDPANPGQFIPLAGATLLAASGAHRCAITATGVFCWGRNNEGQLGIAATLTNIPVATKPDVPITNAVAVSATARTTCFVLADGSVSCLGTSTFFGGVSAFHP